MNNAKPGRTGRRMALYDVVFANKKVTVLCWQDPEGLDPKKDLDAVNDIVYDEMFKWSKKMLEEPPADDRYSPFAQEMVENDEEGKVIVNRICSVNRRTSDREKRDRVSTWRRVMGYRIVPIIRHHRKK